MTVDVWWSSLLAAERELLDLLDATERTRVRSLERAADQGRSMVAAALLRVAVAEHLGVPPADVLVDRTCEDCGRPHGRPRVRGPGGDLPHVSVSHSGLLVLVALADDGPVGVDVQRLADLGARERAGEPPGWEWVRHEAVLKAGGSAARPAVRPIDAPLAGYVAALASSAVGPLTDAEPVVRYWLDRRGVGGAAGRASPRRDA